MLCMADVPEVLEATEKSKFLRLIKKRVRTCSLCRQNEMNVSILNLKSPKHLSPVSRDLNASVEGDITTSANNWFQI